MIDSLKLIAHHSCSNSISGNVFAKVPKSSRHDADPGVISDEEDEFRFEELSHRSSHSSLSVSQVALSTPKDEGSLENLGGGEFLRRNYATPPKQPAKPERLDKKPQQRLSSGPVDDWEAKLFGKQYNLENKPALDTKDDNDFPVHHAKIPEKEKTREPKVHEVIPSAKPKPVFLTTSAISQESKEPVPKPRNVQNPPKSDDSTAKLASTPTPTPAESIQASPNTKPKESIRNSVKESLASIFGGSNKNEEENNQKGTPIAVTNPIRMKDNQHEPRLPKDILKKYENKSREDLIEILINQQATVEYQKQKLSDMEDYIDNLVARVIETQPTLLQSPFVTRHTLK